MNNMKFDGLRHLALCEWMIALNNELKMGRHLTLVALTYVFNF